MNKQIIEEKLKTVKFKGASWDVEFSPSMASIQRMKFQSLAHSEETVFSVKSEGTNLMFNFGDASTHAGHLCLKQMLMENLNIVGVILHRFKQY